MPNFPSADDIIRFLEGAPSKGATLSKIADALKADQRDVEEACERLCGYGSVWHMNDLSGESVYTLNYEP